MAQQILRIVRAWIDFAHWPRRCRPYAPRAAVGRAVRPIAKSLRHLAPQWRVRRPSPRPTPGRAACLEGTRAIVSVTEIQCTFLRTCLHRRTFKSDKVHAPVERDVSGTRRSETGFLPSRDVRNVIRAGPCLTRACRKSAAVTPPGSVKCACITLHLPPPPNRAKPHPRCSDRPAEYNDLPSSPLFWINASVASSCLRGDRPHSLPIAGIRPRLACCGAGERRGDY